MFVFAAQLSTQFPSAMPAAAESLSPERQLEALREENRRLRADQARAQAPGQSDDRGQQARFRTVFDNSLFGQQIITSDLVIRQVNRAMLAMLEYDRPEEVVGHQMLAFVHPDHRDD